MWRMRPVLQLKFCPCSILRVCWINVLNHRQRNLSTLLWWVILVNEKCFPVTVSHFTSWVLSKDAFCACTTIDWLIDWIDLFDVQRLSVCLIDWLIFWVCCSIVHVLIDKLPFSCYCLLFLVKSIEFLDCFWMHTNLTSAFFFAEEIVSFDRCPRKRSQYQSTHSCIACSARYHASPPSHGFGCSACHSGCPFWQWTGWKFSRR